MRKARWRLFKRICGRLAVLAMLDVMTGVVAACASTDAPETSVPETAVYAKIDQLIDDYFAAYNAYDADAVRALITDEYVLNEGGKDPVYSVSTPLRNVYGAAQMLAYVKGSNKRKELQFETLGEPVIAGNGPWLAAQVILATSINYPNGVDGISTFSIVDEGGTLKVARDVFVGFERK